MAIAVAGSAEAENHGPAAWRVIVGEARRVVLMAGVSSKLPATSVIGRPLVLWMLSLALPLWAAFIAAALVSKHHEQAVQSEFAALALESEKALQHRLDSYQQAMLGAAGFFAGSQTVTSDEWRQYVKALGIRRNLPGIGGLGYAVDIPADDVAATVERMRKNGAPAFTIHPSTNGLPFFIVTYIEPLDANEQALGLNLAFEENRREAAILARDSGQPAITRRVLLLQDKSKNPGFLLLHPVHRSDAPLGTVEERRAAFLGWIYAPFVGANLLQSLTQSQGRTLELSVYDGQVTSREALIYGDARQTAANSDALRSLRKTIQVKQHSWTLVWTSTPAFERSKHSNGALLVLIAGLVFTAGIAAFVLLFTRRAATVERLVVEKTKDIAASEEQLKLLIRHTPAAVAMFDRQMRYILTSERWLTDYGLEGQDILGRSHYEVFPEIAGMKGWRDQHARALDGESLTQEEDGWLRPDGRMEWVKWALHPWIDRDGQIGGIVMFTEVITQRKESEQRADLIRQVAIESADAASVPDILKQALGKICAYLQWPVGHAYLWSAEKGFADSTQIWHAEPAIGGSSDSSDIPEIIEFALESRLLGRLLAERGAVFVEEPFGSPPPELGERLRPRAGLGIPIFVRQRVAAVLEFYTPDLVSQDARHLNFLEIIGLQLSRAIERKEAEDARKESDERYERAVQGSSVGLWEWNVASGELYWSPQLLDVAGVPAGEFRGSEDEFEKRVHPDDRECFFAAIHAHLTQREAFDIEYRMVRGDGASVWIHSRGQASWDEAGNPLRMAGSAADITDRKRTESALRQSHRLTNAILGSTTSLIIATDQAGQVIMFNKAAEKTLGYSAAEIVGQPVPSIFDDNEMARRAVALSQSTGETIEPGFEALVHRARLQGADAREWTLLRKDGSRFPVHLTCTPLADADGAVAGFLAVIDDMTERLAQQTALRERELRLRNIIDRAVDGLIVVDENGMVEIFNPACERMFGYESWEIIGKNLKMLMPEQYYHGHERAMRRHQANPGGKLADVIHELEARRKDGSVFPIDLSISDVSLPGRRIFSGVIRDISQRKDTERKVHEYAAELERSNRELDEFAYVASHDLKAPLRVIGNASRWLEEDLADRLTEEDKANMELLRNRVQRMEKLLDDLLAYSRVGRSDDSSFAETVNGKALIDNILLLLSPPPKFEVRVGPGFTDVEVNRMPVQQVLYNLIGNAMKHHDKPAGFIEIGVEDLGNTYRFTVRDDGPGIPSRFHEQVFKMFQTLKPRDQVEGCGMGLAFVKKIVSYYGGEIGLVSTEGEGSAFSFTWPKQQKAVGAVQWKAA